MTKDGRFMMISRVVVVRHLAWKAALCCGSHGFSLLTFLRYILGGAES